MSRTGNEYSEHIQMEDWGLQTRPIRDVSIKGDSVRIVEAVEFLNSVGLRVVSPEFGKSE